MRRILFALVALIASAGAVSAQKTDISLSYGGYTQMDATDCHDGWHHVNNAWGALNVGVNFTAMWPAISTSGQATHSHHAPPKAAPTIPQSHIMP